MIKKVGIIILAALFLGVMFGGFFHSNMETEVAASDCPFMMSGEVICSMTALDHFAAWKSSFVATAPTFLLLLLTLVLMGNLVVTAPNLWVQFIYLPLLSRRFVNPVYSFSYRQFQELFSSGILHPKLF